MPPSATAIDRLEALLDAAVDAIVLIDRHGRIMRFNHAAERIFGFSAAEVHGRNVNVLMPEPYHGEHDGYISRFISTGQARIIGIGREVIARRRDGSHFPIDLSVGEFRNGLEQGFVGILRDISERKAQEEALRETALELRLIFQHAPTAIALIDVAGRVQDANAACLRLLGYAAAALAGLPLSDLVESPDRTAVQLDFERLREGAEAREREVRIRHCQGQEVPVLLYLACARSTQGQPLLYIAEMIDRRALIEATREAQLLRDRLAHAGRLGTMGEMISGIAHELNQPLTAIDTYTSACRRMLTSGQATPGDLLEVLEKIGRQAERAGQVIHSLRTMVRQRQAERERLDLNTLIEDVSQLVETDLRGTEQGLLLDLDAGLPPLLGDGVQIQQVVMNLIRNGLEAMRESGVGGDVRVGTRLAGDGQLEIVVADRGPGLTAEVEARLFDPFVTTKTQGMGLGLSISKSIVHAHRGSLSHRRGAQGGAEFVVRLPTAEEHEEYP